MTKVKGKLPLWGFWGEIAMVCVCAWVCVCVFTCVPVALWLRLPPIPLFRVPFPCSDSVKDSSHGGAMAEGRAGAAQAAEVSAGAAQAEAEADATQAAAERRRRIYDLH